ACPASEPDAAGAASSRTPEGQRVMSDLRVRGAVATAAAAWMALWPAGPAAAQAAAQADDPTVFHRSESLTLRWHLQAGINAVTEQKLFWNLAETTAPGSGYDPSKS